MPILGQNLTKELFLQNLEQLLVEFCSKRFYFTTIWGPLFSSYLVVDLIVLVVVIVNFVGVLSSGVESGTEVESGIAIGTHTLKKKTYYTVYHKSYWLRTHLCSKVPSFSET